MTGEGCAVPRPLPELRLRFKRAFTAYYLDLCSYRVATPGAAYEACAEYLGVRRDHLGVERADRELAEEIARIAGELEQDLRRRYRNIIVEYLATESLEGRLTECARAVRGRTAGS